MADLESMTTTAWSGPWTLEFHWAVVDGVAQCVGISVWGGVAPTSSPDLRETTQARPVRASDLRSIPIGTLMDTSRARWVQGIDDLLESSDRPDEDRERLAAQWSDTRRMRRGGWPVDHLPQVAAFYAQRVRSGDRAPTKAIADRWNVSKSAAAKWVSRCRAGGLLPATERGRVSRPAAKKRRKAPPPRGSS